MPQYFGLDCFIDLDFLSNGVQLMLLDSKPSLSCHFNQSTGLAGVTKREGRKKGKERSERLRYMIWAAD